MRDLITGGAGFIGSHLAEYLVSLGHGVTSLDVIEHPAYKVPGVRYVFGSVEDHFLIEGLVKQHDRVFHLAGVVGFANVMARPAETILTTTQGCTTVFDCCAVHDRPMLYTSTSAVYGHHDSPHAQAAEEQAPKLDPTDTPSWAY